MGTLVELDDYRHPGNGAREVLQRYFAEWPLARWRDQLDLLGRVRQEFELRRVDHMLAWLWVEGFKVVPLSEDDEAH
jgi:hypothetical protein